MSDLPSYGAPPDEDEAPAQTTLADLPGQLKEWLGSVPGRVAGWASDAATVVNDFITRRDIADNATAEAQAFTSNVQQFSQGLDEVVRADPTATNMALGLAALTVPAIVADHPYLPDDQRGDIANALAGQVGQSIARNAVISWAQRDPDTAHAELARLGGLFGDEERTALGDHVDLIGAALDQDRDAAAIQAVNDRADQSHDRQAAYLDELIRPDGSYQFPRDWARRVANDPSVSPEDTARTTAIKERLMAQQAQKVVPPQLKAADIPQFLQWAQGGREGQKRIFDAAAADQIELKDAQDLIRIGRNPAEARYVEQAYNTYKQAINGPDGDLAASTGGDQAISIEFSNLLKGYRTLGAGAFDPNDPNFMGGMRKTFGQDAMNQRIATEQKVQRLEDIFARRAHEHQAHQAAERAVERQRFDITQKEHEIHQEQVKSKLAEQREARETERQWRLEQRGFHEQAVAEQATARMEAHLNEQAAAKSDRRVAEAHIGRTDREPAQSNPTDTFRKFLGLGREPHA